MRLIPMMSCLILTTAISGFARADNAPPVKPNLVLKEEVTGLPRDEKNEVRVLTASFKPGDHTPAHTHDFPVTVSVLEGAYTGVERHAV